MDLSIYLWYMSMKNKWITILIGILLIVNVLLLGGRLPYFLLYVYAGILLLPYIHGRIGKRQLSGTLTLPNKDVIAGEDVALTTTFINPTKYNFPRLTYQNQLAESLSGETTPTKSFHLEANEKFVDETILHCNRRGVYDIGQTTLMIKDVFNLFQFHKKIEAPIALKVYPRLLPLTDFDVEAGIAMGELIVDDPVFQDYSAIDTLRNYQDGDSVKKIHWRSSAKHDEMIVKTFEFKGDAEVMLYLNHNVKNYHHDKEALIEDRIVEIGVSITHFCLMNQLSIHYIDGASTDFHRTSGDNESYFRLFLESFVAFKPEQETSYIEDLQQFRPSIPQGTTFIALTPSLTKALSMELVDMKMNNIRPMVILVHYPADVLEQSDEEKELIKKLSIENIPVSSITL